MKHSFIAVLATVLYLFGHQPVFGQGQNAGNRPPVDVNVLNTPNVIVDSLPSVTVEGTQDVNVTNTPSVIVDSLPDVTIQGTPSVLIQNDAAAAVPVTVVDGGGAPATTEFRIVGLTGPTAGDIVHFEGLAMRTYRGIFAMNSLCSFQFPGDARAATSADFLRTDPTQTPNFSTIKFWLIPDGQMPVFQPDAASGNEDWTAVDEASGVTSGNFASARDALDSLSCAGHSTSATDVFGLVGSNGSEGIGVEACNVSLPIACAALVDISGQ